MGKRHICTVEADDGTVCGREYSHQQHTQDGMCSRCAEGLWDTFVHPLWDGKEPKPFLFGKGE